MSFWRHKLTQAEGRARLRLVATQSAKATRGEWLQRAAIAAVLVILLLMFAIQAAWMQVVIGVLAFVSLLICIAGIFGWEL